MVAALVDAAPKDCFKTTIDDELLKRIKSSYKTDAWCEKLASGVKAYETFRITMDCGT